MSRSNPTPELLTNPCKRWLQWDSTSKVFKYYDKDLPNVKDPSKKGANVMVKLPFNFLVLDVLTTVAGFSDDEQSSFYSNEVRNYLGSTKIEILHVKLKGKTIASGTWEAIKAPVEAMGGKFANSIYIGYFNEQKELTLGNIKFFGASIGAFIETVSKIQKSGRKVEDCAFKIVITKEGKKGSVKWNEPVFEEIKVKEETNALAVAIDVTLQEYLTASMLAGPKPDKVETPVAEASKPTAKELLMQEDDAPVMVASNDLPDDF